MFLFIGLVPGSDTVRVANIGYETAVQPVALRAGETTGVDVKISARPLRVPEVVVQDSNWTRGHLQGQTPVALRGEELREKLAPTVAATLAAEPGIAEQSMGPAPARPVVRGLGGNRLIMLENGTSTGDLSSTSPDHAVAMEVLSAERISIVRGPAAFLYGSSVLGGVVDGHSAL
jgi:iron complex outermembrane receptor protein